MEELITETTLITTELNEIETTTATADLSALSEIDVDSMNMFFYLGTSFILGCLFWFVCKSLYKFLRMFF